MSALTVGSLFSGIGGLDLGHIANLEVLTAAEHMEIHKGKPCEPRPCQGCGAIFTPVGHHRHRQSCCSPACAQAVRVETALQARGLR